LSPGTVTDPPTTVPGLMVTRIAVAPSCEPARLEPTVAEGDLRANDGIGGDREVDRAATALGRVDDLQVLDVHVRGAEDRSDLGEDPGAIWDRDLQDRDPGLDLRLGREREPGRLRLGEPLLDGLLAAVGKERPKAVPGSFRVLVVAP